MNNKSKVNTYKNLNSIVNDIESQLVESSSEHVEEDLQDTIKRTGLAALLGLSSYAGLEMTSAERSPLGRAMYAAAQEGDDYAAQELKNLDLYLDAGATGKVMKLSNKYLGPLEDRHMNEATSYEKDIDPNSPVIVKGLKGMNNKTFTKKFKNMKAADKWMDDNEDDIEVRQVMNEGTESPKGKDTKLKDLELGDNVMVNGKMGMFYGTEGNDTIVKFPDGAKVVKSDEIEIPDLYMDEDSLTEKDEDDPCWSGYEQYGMKTKDGEEVPNCVPVKENAAMKEDDLIVAMKNKTVAESMGMSTQEARNVLRSVYGYDDLAIARAQLDETTSAGSVAAVSAPVGNTKKRSIYSEEEKSDDGFESAWFYKDSDDVEGPYKSESEANNASGNRSEWIKQGSELDGKDRRLAKRAFMMKSSLSESRTIKSLEKKFRAQLSESMNINVSVDPKQPEGRNITVSASEQEADELAGLLSNAGLFSSPGYGEVQFQEPEVPMTGPSTGGCGASPEMAMEEEDPDYTNSPDEKYQDMKYMLDIVSGGLNREKGAYDNAEDGDNPMAVVKEGSKKDRKITPNPNDRVIKDYGKFSWVEVGDIDKEGEAMSIALSNNTIQNGERVLSLRSNTDDGQQIPHVIYLPDSNELAGYGMSDPSQKYEKYISDIKSNSSVVKEEMETAVGTMDEFYDYVMDFYGPGGIYDFNATEEEIKKATEDVKNEVGDDFKGDSVDREKVRDVILNQMRSEEERKEAEKAFKPKASDEVDPDLGTNVPDPIQTRADVDDDMDRMRNFNEESTNDIAKLAGLGQ